MTNRYQLALGAQNACNPGALANTLAQWQREIYDAGGGTDAVRNDPACRLLTYQLAWLMGVVDTPGFDWNAVFAECEELAKKE